MTASYTKKAFTYQEQLNKLTSCGLHIPDSNKANAQLKRISYYRLQGYCYPFRQRNSSNNTQSRFVPNTTWEQIMTLYEFDQQLRLLVLDAIEKIEVAIRAQLTYYFSHTYGTFGHIDSNNFHSGFNHDNWIKKINDESERAKDKSKFIVHYRENHEECFPKIPIWMLTEIISFGNLSFFYKGLKQNSPQNENDKKQISDYFNIPHKRLTNWLEVLTYLRNICAHHGRLWNLELSIKPERINDRDWQPLPSNHRIFYSLLILRYLLLEIENGKEWITKMNNLLTPIAENKNWRNEMGMPDNWKTHPIWCR